MVLCWTLGSELQPIIKRRMDDYHSTVGESTKATLTTHAVAQLKNGADAMFHNNS